MNIRKATLEDAAALAALGAKTFYDTFRPYNSEADMQAYIGKTYTPEAVRRNLQDPAVCYFLALDGETPVGYTKLIRDAVHEQLPGRNIELEKIYVLHAYFDRKVGLALMQDAISFAKEEGFDTLFLGVWQENTRAIAFYEKAGFEVFATRTFNLGQQVCNDFIMKLDL